MGDANQLPWDNWYEPPRFTLFEFDDASISSGPDQTPRRWFVGWHGHMGRPAGQVHLGWRSGRRNIEVISAGVPDSSTTEPDVEAKFNAVFALTNSAFLGPVTSLADKRRLVDELPRSIEIWSPVPVSVDGHTTEGAFLEVEGCFCGYALIGELPVSFAYRGVKLDSVPIRSLVDGRAYGVDPMCPQRTPDAAQQEWTEFFRDRPDLDPDRTG